MKFITRQRKRPLSLLLALAMIFSIFSIMPLSAFAAEPAPFGTEFTDGALTYNTYNTTVSVSGYDDTVETDVVIPESVTYNDYTYPVTAIGASAFRGNTNITSLNIPGTVNQIAINTIRDCTSLKKVTLNEGTTQILGAAFMNDTALTDVNFPESLTSIAASAFNNTGLTEIAFLKDITIAKSFNNCVNLTKIEIYENLTTSSTPFSGCTAVKDVYFYNKEMTISSTMLDGANSALIVYGYAGSTAETFASEKGFTFVPFEDDVTEPATTAPETSEPETTVPATEATTAPETSGPAIEATTAPETTEPATEPGPQIPAVGDVITQSPLTYTVTNNEEGSLAVSVTGFDNSTAEVNIPENITYNGFTFDVTAIANTVFQGNTSITSVNIPGTVKIIDSSSFKDCTSLQTVTLNEGTEQINGSAFRNTAISEIDFPDSITNIDNWAFRETKLKEVTLKNVSVNSYTFGDCTDLKTIYVYENVTFSTQPSFRGSTAIEDVYFYDRDTVIPNPTLCNTSSVITIHGYWGSTAHTYSQFVPPAQFMYDKPDFIFVPFDQPATEPTTEPETEVTEPATTAPVTDVTEPATTVPETEATTADETTVPETSETPSSEPTSDPTEYIEYILGDSNCDGVVDVKDATNIQMFAAGFITADMPFDALASDVNLDGVVDIKDATQIQLYAAKFPVEFPIGEVMQTVAPTIPADYYVAGDFINGWTVNSDKMTYGAYKFEGKNYNYAITVENVAAGSWAFKVTDGTWDNAWPSANFSFTTSDTGYVTVYFNSDSKEIAVDAEYADTWALEFITAVGNGTAGESWLNGISWDPAAEINKMTEVAPGIWEITFENVYAFDNYNVKFACNGSWQPYNWNFDGVLDGQDHASLPVAEDGSTVTLRIDISGFDFTIGAGKVVTYFIVNGEVVKTNAKTPDETDPTVPETTEPETSVPATEPDPEPEYISFYVVNAAGWLNNDGCKIWIYNNATGEFDSALEYLTFEKAYYFEIPSTWTDLSFYRTKFEISADEFDINSKFNQETNPDGIVINEWYGGNRGGHNTYRATADGEGVFADIEDEVFELTTVYFDNTVTQWDEVYIYGWDASIGLNQIAILMTDEGNGIWSYTFTNSSYPSEGAKSFLFVNKFVTNSFGWDGATQTNDVAVEANKNLCIPTTKDNAGKYNYEWAVYNP